jgi:cell division septation protein DedD
MDLAELRRRVAEVLGVSASQDELAFEVFSESVSETLTEGITLKVPRVGFFQVKTANLKTNRPQQLLFSSLPEDYTKEARTLYLTIDVHPRIKNPIDFDSQVFSIGVGKPLLPLLEEGQDFETSFAILRKSIEERVRELIAEADQIPNFNMWEDSFPKEDDELEVKTDLTDKRSESTKDFDIASFNNRESFNENGSNEDFLKSLLAQNSFEITDDFSVDTNDNVVLPENVSNNLPPAFDDALFDAQLDFSSPDISVNELLDDKTFYVPSENEHVNLSEQESQEVKEIVEENNNDMVYGEIPAEELKGSELTQQLTVSDLLESDDVISEEEINVEPPTSTKYLLFDLLEKENKLNDPSSDWNIEHEHLQGIVQEELQEYDSEKIADENSRVLNNLLEETEPEVNSNISEVISSPVLNEQPIEKTANEELSDEIDPEEKPVDKIEWSWGDELKEEFGIGSDSEIEIDAMVANDFGSDTEDDEKVVDNRMEDVNSQTEEIDTLADFASKYTKEINSRQTEEFDLRKTRIDLFTRLEKTLEKEVTFLKEEFEKPATVEIPEAVTPSKIFTRETEVPKIDFKDEKVFLDFKTPPPKYEFYEEKEEPVLTRPKRITILLAPDEEIYKNPAVETEFEPVQAEEKVVTKNNFFWKAFAIIFSAFVVLFSVIFYLFLSGRLNNTKQEIQNQTAHTKDIITEPAYKNTIMETTKDNSPINMDEFSDFPRTATPPVPIKQGTDIGSLDIPAGNSPNQKLEVKITKPAVHETKSPENIASQKNDVYKKIQNDVRVSNMIFSDGKTFNFQHSSWRRKDLAEHEVTRLRDLGFNAFLIEAFLPEKGGTWYRVRIGSFKSEQEAALFMSKNKF